MKGVKNTDENNDQRFYLNGNPNALLRLELNFGSFLMIYKALFVIVQFYCYNLQISSISDFRIGGIFVSFKNSRKVLKQLRYRNL